MVFKKYEKAIETLENVLTNEKSKVYGFVVKY